MTKTCAARARRCHVFGREPLKRVSLLNIKFFESVVELKASKTLNTKGLEYAREGSAVSGTLFDEHCSFQSFFHLD